MPLMDEVRVVFRDVFDNPELVVTEETNASHIEDWDSFTHINLIVAFEEKFNVKFTTKEIGELTCVGDMLNLLRSKGVK